MSAYAAESLQETNGKMASSFWTKCHYALNRGGFWGNNGHCSQSISLQKKPSTAPIFFKQKFVALHPHHPWTMGPFTTFEFAEFHCIPHFSLLFCFTASKVLGSNRKRGAWDLSAVPFPSSCYSSLVHSMCENSSVLSTNQAHNNFWFLSPTTPREHPRLFQEHIGLNEFQGKKKKKKISSKLRIDRKEFNLTLQWCLLPGLWQL